MEVVVVEPGVVVVDSSVVVVEVVVVKVVVSSSFEVDVVRIVEDSFITKTCEFEKSIISLLFEIGNSIGIRSPVFLIGKNLDKKLFKFVKFRICEIQDNESASLFFGQFISSESLSPAFRAMI